MPNSTAARIGKMHRKIIAIFGLMVIAMITENRIISGVRTARRISSWYAFCTLVTSVVIRVTRDDAENLSISAKAKS